MDGFVNQALYQISVIRGQIGGTRRQRDDIPLVHMAYYALLRRDRFDVARCLIEEGLPHVGLTPLFSETIRDDLAATKIRHFLEVFNPAFDIKLQDATLGQYANDCIVRTLAGLGRSEQPLFLKLQYNGAAAMEELASYDPTRLVVGILGGAKGTTRDTFELAAQAEKHGARVALFGRKINLAESPLDLVQTMRHVIERDLTAAEGVKAYHDCLAKKKLTPALALAADSVITDPVLKA